ncbi:MAG: isoaspartyl peptidase [Deltaproteobacteria bacterium]|nr:isoaspartyl peptidase [Deltaproteobacteria bacterium]
MHIAHGTFHAPIVALHGGAGGQDPKSPDAVARATAALVEIARTARASILSGTSAADVLLACLKAMEADPQFNAGRGSALQADGCVRMTAAVMTGASQTFSGVIGATDMLHPSVLAHQLQHADARVLASPGVELLARELGVPVASPVTPARLTQWVSKKNTATCDTVGCLILTADGKLYAGTSTGGRGFETPGRVSDSATVAGTYASACAAISATGIGEQIIDDAVAARIETRCRDGMSLETAAQTTFSEAEMRGRSYGWIALAKDGAWSAAHTTPAMSFVIHGADAGEVARS